MLKPAGPKIDTNGNGETVKRAKMIKLVKMVKRLSQQGREMAKMLKPTGPKIDKDGK